MISKAGRFDCVGRKVMCLKLQSPRCAMYWKYSILLEISDLFADMSRMKMQRLVYRVLGKFEVDFVVEPYKT